MPELPDVTQDFVANADEFLRTLDDMIAKAEALAAAMKDADQALAKFALDAETAAEFVRMFDDVLDDTMISAGAASKELNNLRESVEQVGAAGAAAGSTGLGSLDSRLDDLIMLSTAAVSELHDLRTALLEVSLASVPAAAGVVAAASAGGRAAGVAAGFWARWGNVIHWVISGTAEFLAVAIPAAIAIAAGAFVMYQGVVEDAGRRLQALYNATEATSALFHKTTGDVLGLGHAFQSAQNAANPIAYELLGEYIATVRSHMVDLAGAGLTLSQRLGELGARIEHDVLSNGPQWSGLLANMTQDAIGLGQVLGNLGHAVLNFASDMPGLAEVLLHVADALSQVILFATHFGPLITLAMVFEEVNRWGGAVVGVFGRMGLAEGELATGILNPVRTWTIFRSLLMVIPSLIGKVGTAVVAVAPELGIFAGEAYAAGTAMEDFAKGTKASLLGLPTGVGLALVGLSVVLGFIIFKLVTAKSAAQQFTDTLEAGISKSTNVNALNTISQSIGAINQQLTKIPESVREYSGPVQASWHGLGQQIGTAELATRTFTAAQQQMVGQFGNVVTGADKISRAYGTDFAGSLALADAAGVKLANTQLNLGRNANIAGLQIKAMVDGYKAMDQVGGTLGVDMNAFAIQAGIAGTKVSQLNQALDQFVGNATGLTSTLATLNQDITQLGNTGVATGQAFRVFTGHVSLSVQETAKALQSFTGTGAQAWQNYDAAIQQAQQFTDQLRIATTYGGISVKTFNGIIADTTASLLPFASRNKTAVEVLSTLAQEAGGPATSNYKTLKDWVDKNKISTGEFNKAIQQITGQLSNAGAAAKQFASTLQTQMQNALAQALISSNNVNGAVQQFQQAVLHAGGQISSSSPQYKHLYDMLKAAGFTATQAKNELKLLQQTINSMHGTNLPINVTTYYNTVGRPGGMPRAGTTGATGGYVTGPGTSTSDSIPARLSHGEYVMKAAAVEHYGRHIFDAMNAQRYAGGGPAVTPGSGALATPVISGGASPMVLTLHLRSDIKLNDRVVGSAQRTQTLIYNRRNPNNSLGLTRR